MFLHVMREQFTVSIEKALIKRLKEKAQGNLVTVGRYVNDLIRNDLLGRGVAVAGTVTAQAAPDNGKCKKCKGTGKVPMTLGCKDIDNHMDRWKFYNERGACDICHDCFDPEGMDPEAFDMSQEPVDFVGRFAK